MAICNLRARVAILWLVLTLLIVGIVVWAISAEVVMGAMRESVRKNSDSSTLKLYQLFNVTKAENVLNEIENLDNSDDFSIHRINNKVGHSIKSGLRHSETALIREVDKQGHTNRVTNNRFKSGDDFYSYDQRSDETNNSNGDEEEDESEAALESIAKINKKISTTKAPLSVNFDLEKLRKGLTRAQVAKVIDQLFSQTKNKEQKSHEIVVGPTQVSPKKPKTNKSSTKLSTNSQKISKPSKTTTTSTTTTSKPMITRTTLKPFGRSRIQSLSLRLSNSAVTTTKPKRTKLKVSTIKIRRTTTTTTPPTTTSTARTTTTKKSIPTKLRQRLRKTSIKSPKNSASKFITTTTTTESSKIAELELLKSKMRQKELEYILNKVESLEKQQKRFLKQSNQDLLMEGSFRDSVVKPKYEVISFRQKQPEFSSSYSSRHNYDTQDKHNTQKSSGWQPTSVHTPPTMHLPPPPPPPPPIPNGPPHPHPHPPPPPQPVFHNPEHYHQMPPQQHVALPPPPPQPYPEPQGFSHFENRPVPEPNMNHNNGHMKENFFNGVFPLPNRAISSGNSDPQVAQESHPMEYQIKQRGHVVQKSEKPGIQLSFGGGPMGGGGQLKTSPMGIFKTLLLPLLPKPRMNLNGKVVFGVVLENGVGFGKKPKIVAQHFSTGRI